MKKIVLLLILFILLFYGCQMGETPEKAFNIYCWNTEFKDRFDTFFAYKIPDDVSVNWIITSNQNNAYQIALDKALLQQNSLQENERIDIFLVEADYAMKYTNTNYTLDVINDIGLTEDDLANQYPYTKDIMTSSNGALKGVSWQACPGGFVYRRSYMEDVFGTGDPATITSYLDDWDKFNAAAVQAKAEGYFMLSGVDDSFRVFSDNISSKWVDNNNKIIIDPQIEGWINQAKYFTDNGYNNQANLWSTEWFNGISEDGNVIGFFGPSWFIDFVILPSSKADSDGPNAVGNGCYGDWALIKGPQGFFWGGSWICAAAGTDDIDLIKDLMYSMTVDKETLKSIAITCGDFSNNQEAMQEIANTNYSYDFLGGQNHIPVFIDSAMSVRKTNISSYDQGMMEKIQYAFENYFDGTKTKTQAWDNFYSAVLQLYPELER